MYKEDLALNNLQWLICHKTKLRSYNNLYATAQIITTDNPKALTEIDIPAEKSLRLPICPAINKINPKSNTEVKHNRWNTQLQEKENTKLRNKTIQTNKQTKPV